MQATDGAAAPQTSGARIDRSFGVHGMAQTRLPPSYEAAPFTDVIAEPDGGALARVGGWVSWTYRRYRADGSLQNGYTTDAAEPRPEAVGANGSRLTVRERAVLRWNADGSPDSSFGSGGTSGKLPFTIDAIVPLSSGSILLGGTGEYVSGTKGGDRAQAFLARLTSDGKLDTGFGEGGLVELNRDEGVAGEEFLQLLPRPDDGAIVAVNGWAASLAVLDGSGQLDRSFGNAGRVELSEPIVGLGAAGEGKFLVAGSQTAAPAFSSKNGRLVGSDFLLARYTATGQLDSSFAEGKGVVLVDLGGQDEAHAVLWEPNGTVLLAGSTTPETVRCRRLVICQVEPLLVRFAAGGLDHSFGSGGVVRLHSLVGPAGGDYTPGVAALAARPEGGVFAVGGTSLEAFVAALAPNGSLVPSFGGGIVGDRTLEPSETHAGTIAVDAKQRILVAGRNNANTSELTAAVLRYTRNGRLDTKFGEGGYAPVPEGVGDVAPAPDGSTFVVSNGGQLAVTKLTPSGQVDSAYGIEGSALLGTDNARRAPGGRALALLPDGDLLVAGSAPIRGGRAAMFRLRPDGTLRRHFGKGGEAVIDFGRDRTWDALDMVVLPSGRIILAGDSNRRHGKSWYVYQIALMAVRANGTIDRSFGRGGAVVAPVPGRGYATGLALQGKKILVAGETEHNSRFADVLFRYRRDGRLDRGFARRGVAKAPVHSVPDHHEAREESLSVVPTAGRILVVRGSGEGRPILAFGKNGTRDRRFGKGRRLIPGPHAGALSAVQKGELILAWNAPGRPSPLGRSESEVRLDRLILR
jgi:uncharacterized delta-60 repeat protein